MLKEGKSEEALSAFRKSVDIQPNNPEALQKLALLNYYRMNQSDTGLACMKKAAALAPGNAFIQNDLGTMLLDQQRLEQAIEHLENAHRAITENFESEYNPFDSRYKLGLMLSPRHAKSRLVNPIVDIQLALGRAYYERGDFTKSVRVLAALATGDGIRQADVHARLALALQASGDKDAAAVAWERADRLNPTLTANVRITPAPQSWAR